MIGQSIFGWTRMAVMATALLGLLAVAAMAILLWQPAPALAQSPPDAVGSITLTRSGTTLTVSWNAVSGAAKYHALYQADGAGDWLPPIPDYQNITATSFSFDIDSGKSYVVGVRAGNEHGWGAWTDSPVSNPPLPAAVGSITLTRTDNALTVSWNAVSGATKYHAVYQADGGDWLPPVPDHKNITDTSFSFDIDSSKSYVVGVRAGNSAGWGPWTDSPASGPYTPPTPTPTPTPEPEPPATPAGLTATPGDGSITLAWDDPGDSTITGYEYNVNRNDTGTGNFSGWSAWTAIAGSGADTVSHTFTGLVNGREYRYHLRAVNAQGAGVAAPNAPPWFVSAVPVVPPVTLTANEVTTTTATVAIGNWSGAWHYRASGGSGGASGDNGDCAGPVQGSQTTITGLDPNSSYTINAYADACGGAAMASEEFATIQSSTLTLERLYGTSAVLGFASQASHWRYQADTGPHTTCSGSLTIVKDAHLGGLTPLTQYTYRAYTDANCANEAASVTFTTLRADLAVSNLTAGSVTLTPNPAHWPGNYWLRGDTATVNVCHGPYTGSASVGGLLPRSSFDFEMHSTSSCNDSPHLGYAEFIPPYATLTATHVSANSATLELGGWTQREWYYRRTEPSGDNTCHTKSAGDTTITLTGLQPNTQYAYWAHRNSNCAAENSLRSTGAPGITFSTVSMAASEPGATTATITLNGGHHGQPWWYAETAMNPSHSDGQPLQGNCHYGGVSKSGGSPVVVSGLVPGNGNSSKPYTFTAYSDADCTPARAMGSVNASTLSPTLSANTLSGGGARLTLGNWGANDPDWHYRANVVVPGSGNIVLHGPDGCNAAASGALQADIASLPPLVGYGAYYIFTAYSASGCHYSKVAASALLGGPRDNPSLTASNVTSNGATLVIADYPGTWYYKATAGPHTTCQGPVHAATEALTGLAAGTSYTYSAYSDSTCATGNLLATAAAFTTPVSLTASSITATTATLTIAGYSGNWYYKHTNTGATCDGPVSTTTKDLTSLTAGTSYTYSAYSDSACNTLLVTAAAFTTPSLTASDIGGDNGNATLTFNQSYAWWYKRTSGGDDQCYSVAAGTTTATVSSLTGNTSYTYKAYDKAECNSADEIASVTFRTIGFTNSNVGHGSATLNISDWAGDWWFKQTNPTGTGDPYCRKVDAGTTGALAAGLHPGTSYTFKAYIKSDCANAVGTTTFTTTTAQPPNNP